MLVTFYRMGSGTNNYDVPEGSTVNDLMNRENISVGGAFSITVNGERVNGNHVLNANDRVSVQREEIKGG